MLLKYIKLKNFRQYRGEQMVEFSCDPHKNVTVFLGENTSGKTTLVQSFKWVLYGSVTFPSDILLNIELLKEMNPGNSEQVEVEISLEHDKTEYCISRTQNYICESKGDANPSFSTIKIIRKMGDGQTKIITDKKDIESTINKILPKDLSNYFFFDGERIESISRDRDITDAVKGLLGLSTLENAIDHLKPSRKDTVYGKFRESLVKGDEEAEKINKELEQKQDELDEIEILIFNVDDNLKHYNARKEVLEGKLRDNQEVSKAQKEREINEQSKIRDEERLQDRNKMFIRNFNTYTISGFARPLIEKAQKLLKSAEVDNKGIPHMDASSIDFILKKGQCVCGRRIRHGDEAYNNLLEQRRYLPPQSIGIAIQQFTNDMEQCKSSVEKHEENIQSHYKDILELRSNIREYEDNIYDLSEIIRGKVDTVKIEEELLEIKNKIKNEEQRKENLNIEKAECSTLIKLYEKEIGEHLLASEKNKKIRLYMEYTEELYEWFKNKYDVQGEDIRRELEKSVNEIFNKMYHGQRKILIDNRYRIDLYTEFQGENIKTDESKGLETVKNFAFICGLVDLARKKVNKRTNGDIEDVIRTEPYPLIMDAPFSNADEKHVKSISRVLPDIAEQVIMVVMEKDWRYAEEIIGSKVGMEYILNKKSETLTDITKGD